MFNQDLKEKFLNAFENKETRTTYRRIFIKSESSEEMLNKDLYNFTREEIEIVLEDLDPMTNAISQSNGRIISSYINWCISKGLTNNNPLKTVDPEWFDRFVDKDKKLYFSYKEIKQIEDWCENAQDAAIVRLYFENIVGREAIEIRNLKMSSVNEEKETITLTTGEEKKVSSECIKLIKEAFSEKIYLKKNGLMADTDNVRQFTDLVDNEYVIRNSITKTDSYSEPVHISLIYRRLSMISELLGLPYFTGKNIYRSGIIYYAKQVFDEEKELGKDQYKKIAKKFGIKNYYTLNTYVNIENIEKLYHKESARII